MWHVMGACSRTLASLPRRTRDLQTESPTRAPRMATQQQLTLAPAAARASVIASAKAAFPQKLYQYARSVRLHG
jgi:hypothetical protein